MIVLFSSMYQYGCRKYYDNRKHAAAQMALWCRNIVMTLVLQLYVNRETSWRDLLSVYGDDEVKVAITTPPVAADNNHLVKPRNSVIGPVVIEKARACLTN